MLKHKLKPPKNYREIKPRCCPTCKHYVSVGELDKVAAECERSADNGPIGDIEDYMHVCDYYKAT